MKVTRSNLAVHVLNRNNYSRLILLLLVFYESVLFECSHAPNSPPSINVSTPLKYTIMRSFTPHKVPEPSGVVFDADRGALFIAGDRGDIGEFSLTGALLNHRNIDQADFEGITCNPASGLLYAVVEAKGKIVEIDPDSLQRTREFFLDWIFNGRLILNPKKESIESIAFAPDSLDANGGIFFLANKSVKIEDTDQPSLIIEAALPLASTENPPPASLILKTIYPGIFTMSDLYFDAASQNLFVLSDSTDLMFQMDTAGQIIQSFKLPGDRQEGVTAVSDSSFVITDDTGPVFLISYVHQE
jgi:hypothetical protein